MIGQRQAVPVAKKERCPCFDFTGGDILSQKSSAPLAALAQGDWCRSTVDLTCLVEFCG